MNEPGAPTTDRLQTDRDGGWPQLLTLSLASALAMFMMLSVSPMLATLSEYFGQPVSSVAWTLVIVSIMGTAFGAAMAGLGMLWGNRLMLIIALLAILGGAVLGASAKSLSVLIVARGIQGLGFGLMPLCMGIVATYYSGHKMRRGLSMIVACVGAGGISAYLLSGILIKAGAQWNVLFWVMAGISILTLLLTFAFVKETPKQGGVRVDWAGAIGVLLWSILILLPLSQANVWGFGSMKVIGMLVAGVALLVIWVIWELRVSAPLLDLRVLAKPGVWQGTFVWAAAGFIGTAGATIMSYLIQTPHVLGGYGFGLGVFAVSLVMTSASVVTALAAPTTPLLLRKIGSKSTLVLGALAGCSYLAMAAWHSEIWMLALFVGIWGLMVAWGGAAFTVATEAVSPEKGVVASGVINTSASLLSAVGGAVAGYVLTLQTNTFKVPGSPATVTLPAANTFTWIMVISGAVGVLAVIVTFTINPRKFEVVERETSSPSIVPTDA